jgi:hypothetical protein
VPFTSQEIIDAGKIGLDFYLKNTPIDQIAVERPVLKYLMGKKTHRARRQAVRRRAAPRSLPVQLPVVQRLAGRHVQPPPVGRAGELRVALRARRLLPRRGPPDPERRVSVSDDGPGGNASDAERLQLTNLLEEQTEILRLGFQEKFSQALHLDGTQSADAVTGLDALVSLTPTTGTVGGIDRAAPATCTGATTPRRASPPRPPPATSSTSWKSAWRACVRNGGKPDFIVAGSTFVDGFRNFMLKTFGRIDFEGASERVIEGGTKVLTFHGVSILWSPEFADLDTLYAPATAWEKRAYFINGRHAKLRPIQGQDMITRKPPRAYDKYEYYWGLTWRGAVSLNRSNAQAVLSVA